MMSQPIIAGIGFVIALVIQWLIFRRIQRLWLRLLFQVPLLVLTAAVALQYATQPTEPEGLAAVPAELPFDVLDRMVIAPGDLEVTVGATGTIAPVRQVPLVFQLAGSPVRTIDALEGERVETGDIIARLDVAEAKALVENARIALDLQLASFASLTAEPRPEDIAAAEAAVQAAQSQVNASAQTGPTTEQEEIARLQVEIARNQLWQVQLQRDQIPILEIDVPEQFVDDLPPEALDLIAQFNNQARANFLGQLDAAAEAIEQVDYGVQIAGLNYEGTLARGADVGSIAAANAELVQSQIALDRLINGPDALTLSQASIELELAEIAVEQAELTVAQGELVAPFAGVIAQNDLVVGELPPQGAAVLLVDDSRFFVDLPVDETDIAQVQIGQTVEFEVDALPDQRITGTVTSIAYTPLQLDQLVAYNVRVALDSADAVRVGMTVTGRVLVQDRRDVLLVRNNLVRFDRLTGDAFVDVLTPQGQLEERFIVLGERNEIFSEVLSGLAEGEEVVAVAGADGFGG